MILILKSVFLFSHAITQRQHATWPFYLNVNFMYLLSSHFGAEQFVQTKWKLKQIILRNCTSRETHTKYHIFQKYRSCAQFLSPVVRRLDNAIHRIKRYPVDKFYNSKPHYTLDSDLSGGQRYVAFKKLHRSSRSFGQSRNRPPTHTKHRGN